MSKTAPVNPEPVQDAVVGDGAFPQGPPIPNTLSFSNLPAWITYFGSFALFMVGLLTSAGVVLPSGVSGMIQALTGGAVTIASLVVALVGMMSHHSVQKAAIAAPLTQVDPPLGRSSIANEKHPLLFLKNVV
jgi:hypothetical protein